MYDDQIFATQKFGGISRYICEIASRIADKHTVLVSAGLSFNHHLLEKQNLRKWGLNFDVQKGWTARDFINQRFTSISSMLFAPDLVHETYYRSKSLHSSRTKIVVTVHDLIHEKYPEESFHANFFSKLKGEAVKRADAIVCVSHTTKRDLIHYFPDVASKRVEVIPHGHSYTAPSTEAIDRLSAITHNRPYILFVGHRAGYKNFADLVAAFKIVKSTLPNHILVAFGGGAFTDAERAQILTTGLRLSEVIQFSGSDDLLNAAYTRASAFCYPSLYEGFGIPILEAVSAGCPTVCSNTEIFKEVGEGLVGFFEPGCHHSMASELITAIKGDRHYKDVPSQYSWQRSSESHRILYESLVNSN